jgi:hypothetical protein
MKNWWEQFAAAAMIVFVFTLMFSMSIRLPLEEVDLLAWS